MPRLVSRIAPLTRKGKQRLGRLTIRAVHRDDMARRSVMFTPGDRAEMLQKAPEAGADVLVFDLEDAVVRDQKDTARKTIREVLSRDTFDPAAEVCLRVNQIGRAAATDLNVVLDGISTAALDSIMLPKVESAKDITDLATLLEERNWSLPILALIETASGVIRAPAIAAADPTNALVFGAEDFAADVGASRTVEGTEVLYARERVVVAAAASDVDAIDTVHTDFNDEAGLRSDAEFSRELGYDGKLAIHPSQVSVINEAFTPPPDQVDWARKVKQAEREADIAGRGVFEVDGQMIDAPLIAQADRILERATAADEDSSSE